MWRGDILPQTVTRIPWVAGQWALCTVFSGDPVTPSISLRPTQWRVSVTYDTVQFWILSVCLDLKYCLHRLWKYLKVLVQFNRSVMSDSLWPMNRSTPGLPVHHQTHSNSCPLSWWCHPAILSSVVPFSSCPQSLPATGSFQMSQLFSWGGQSIGVSALASVLPKNTQDWSRLEWTGWISLQSKGLSRVFSNTTVQKHQFFGTQLSSQSNSHIRTWPLEKR